MAGIRETAAAEFLRVSILRYHFFFCFFIIALKNCSILVENVDQNRKLYVAWFYLAGHE